MDRVASSSTAGRFVSPIEWEPFRGRVAPASGRPTTPARKGRLLPASSSPWPASSRCNRTSLEAVRLRRRRAGRRGAGPCDV